GHPDDSAALTFPVAFTNYDRKDSSGNWVRVVKGIPTYDDVIRVPSDPWRDPWSGESRLPAAGVQLVAAGRNAAGRLEIFYAKTSGMYHSWQTSANVGAWSAEGLLSSDTPRQLAVGQNADGRLEIFYITDKGLYHVSQVSLNGAWATPESL